MKAKNIMNYTKNVHTLYHNSPCFKYGCQYRYNDQFKDTTTIDTTNENINVMIKVIYL